MKNKNLGIKLISLSLACAVAFGGCASEIPELTPEQEQQVGEYAAFAMLKYDAEHRSRLVDYSEVEAADEKARAAAEAAAAAELAREIETGESSKPEGTYDANGNLIDVVDSSAGGAAETVSMEEFLELASGITLTYQGYTVQGSYPEESDVSEFFAVDATPGKKFLVLWYSLYNGSGSDQHINFLSDNISMRGRINNDFNVTGLVTMLDDDMSTLDINMKNDEERECVLIFELDEDAASDIDSIVIKLVKDNSDWERKLL